MQPRAFNLVPLLLLASCLTPQKLILQANLALTITNISPEGRLLWVVALDEQGNRRDLAPLLPQQAEPLDVYVSGLQPGRFSVQVQVMNDLSVVQCYRREDILQRDKQLPIQVALNATNEGPCDTVPGCLSALPPDERCNGIDDDCDGFADDGLPEIVVGVGACQCRGPSCAGGTPVGACTPRSPEPTERCNGADDDCDGILPQDEADNDNDGFISCAPCALDASLRCGDCDNDKANMAPGLPELCDGFDNDCNGLIDDGLACL